MKTRVDLNLVSTDKPKTLVETEQELEQIINTGGATAADTSVEADAAAAGNVVVVATEDQTPPTVTVTAPTVIRVKMLAYSSFEPDEDWGPYTPMNWMIKLHQNETRKAYGAGNGSVYMKNGADLTSPPALTYEVDNVQDYSVIRVDFRYLPNSPTNGDGVQLLYRPDGSQEWSEPFKKWIQDYSLDQDEPVTPEAYSRVVDRFRTLDGKYKLATALLKVTPEMGSKVTLRWQMISPTDNGFTLHLDDVAVYGVPIDAVSDDTSNFEYLVFPSQLQFPFDSITPSP
jgi:hypothetical protein